MGDREEVNYKRGAFAFDFYTSRNDRTFPSLAYQLTVGNSGTTTTLADLTSIPKQT